MKKLILLLAAAYLALPPARAQKSESVLSHVFLPIDIGYALPGKTGIQPGLSIKASLEYRFDVSRGWLILGEINDHSHKYDIPGISAVNVSSGDVHFFDILAGPGYRFPVSDRFSVAAVAQAGVAAVTSKNAAPSAAAPGTFEISDCNELPFAAKGCLFFEYYADSSVAIIASVSLPATFSATAVGGPGVLMYPTVAIGFTCSLY